MILLVTGAAGFIGSRVVKILLLLLKFAQVLVEPVEALLPEPAVVPHPVGHLAQRLRL